MMLGARTRVLLELGSGYGRDAVFFARHGFRVQGVELALETGQVGAPRSMGGEGSFALVPGDAQSFLERQPAHSADAVYSHLFYNMDFTAPEHRELFRSVWRVLRPGGLHLYSVRSTRDPWFGRGRSKGKDRYEIEPGGITLHFFSRAYADRVGSARFSPVARAEAREGKSDFPVRLLYVVDRARGARASVRNRRARAL